MQIAILVFEKLTALDAIGPYEVLSRVPGVELTFVSTEAGQLRTDTGRLASRPTPCSRTSRSPTSS